MDHKTGGKWFIHISTVLTIELREWGTFQLMIWDTGSGDIDIGRKWYKK